MNECLHTDREHRSVFDGKKRKNDDSQLVSLLWEGPFYTLCMERNGGRRKRRRGWGCCYTQMEWGVHSRVGDRCLFKVVCADRSLFLFLVFCKAVDILLWRAPKSTQSRLSFLFSLLMFNSWVSYSVCSVCDLWPAVCCCSSSSSLPLISSLSHFYFNVHNINGWVCVCVLSEDESRHAFPLSHPRVVPMCLCTALLLVSLLCCGLITAILFFFHTVYSKLPCNKEASRNEQQQTDGQTSLYTGSLHHMRCLLVWQQLHASTIFHILPAASSSSSFPP